MKPSVRSEHAGIALDKLTEDLRNAADPLRSGPMAAYMRGQFAFFGIQTPVRHAIVRAWLYNNPITDRTELRTSVSRLWSLKEREYQYAACDILRRYQDLLTPADLPFLKRIITTKSWWDTVDAISPHPVGSLVLRCPELLPAMDSWSKASNFWLRRAALLHQLQYGKHTDWKRLRRYCRELSSDPEFFIRKAIGWALRQYARTDPERVADFVRTAPLSSLSRSEAMKHITVQHSK